MRPSPSGRGPRLKPGRSLDAQNALCLQRAFCFEDVDVSGLIFGSEKLVVGEGAGGMR